MNFLNLSFGELLGLAGIVSAGVVALYLLDRTKRKQVVATLRFWTAGKLPEELKHKRRVHQPWSLLLQVISMILLLLAIAGPRFGDLGTSRDHVLLLDTSAWMGARARQGILLDQAKNAALVYVNSLPLADRVMLVRADALATPVTQFESNKRARWRRRFGGRGLSTSALNLEQALEFAQQAQKLQSLKAGEIVFVGAARIPKQENEIAVPANLRVISIPSNGENVGLRKLGVRRAATGADNWEAFVELRNDGQKAREITLLLQFAGTAAGSKTMTLAAGSETQATFTFQAKKAGLLEARVTSTNGRGDAFPQDDTAVIEVPIVKPLRVAVYSPEPDLLKPLLAGNAQVEATFDLPAKFDAQAAADIFVFDRFVPKDAPKNVASIWIEPPVGSPFAIRANAANVKLQQWHQETALGAGLNTKDVDLAATEVFNLAPGDQAVADTAQGPVVVERPGAVKMAALGFDPVRSAMKYDLATPLFDGEYAALDGSGNVPAPGSAGGNGGHGECGSGERRESRHYKSVGRRSTSAAVHCRRQQSAIFRRGSGECSRRHGGSGNGLFTDAAGCGRYGVASACWCCAGNTAGDDGGVGATESLALAGAGGGTRIAC